MTLSIRDGSAIPDSPIWILRHHAPSSIHYLRVIQSDQNDLGGLLVIAGDSEGRCSLTSLHDYRQRYFWKAHKESILGVDVRRLGSANVMISSGRDNTLNVFAMSTSKHLTSAVLPSRIQSELPIPESLHTIDINSLNYCPFSALSVQDEDTDEMLVAIPHTVDSGYIDIFHFPTKRRIAAAIGKADVQTKGVKATRAAIVMSLQMLKVKGEDAIRIFAGYEDGYMRAWKVEKGSASLEWSKRCHTESIMAIAVSKDETFAISVAADRQVVRYDLLHNEVEAKSVMSNSAGHACIAIREDGDMIAVGGWDGCVRLYSSDLVQLGSLRYHKDTVQALSFIQHRTLAKTKPSRDDGDTLDSESDEDSGNRDDDTRQSILVSGGKEGRVCIWKT